MASKIYYYMVDLMDTMGDTKREHKEIKSILNDIIRKYGVNNKGIITLDLSSDDNLHFIADIFDFKNEYAFMRLSSQKPTGSFIHRDYETYHPSALLEGASEDKEGIEIYTYVLFYYGTGILSIVNQREAPGHKVLNNMFRKYASDCYLKFVAIPNRDGVDRIYYGNNPSISAIEVDVPTPSADILESVFKWDDKDILDSISGDLSVSIRISGLDRRFIIEGEEQSKNIIDKIKSRLSAFNKAKIRGKADGIKTQDFNFFNEMFSYPIDIKKSTLVNGQVHYYTVEELVQHYKKSLLEAYDKNIQLLKVITNR